MHQEPRLLVWNYTTTEKQKLDGLLAKIGAPYAATIEPDRGYCALRDIIDAQPQSGETLNSDEKVILFYNVPQQGVLFLINFFQQTDLPSSIYAVVTEHSINWPFNKLLEHLVGERDQMQKRSSAERRE